MTNPFPDPDDAPDVYRLKFFFYLVPVLGFFPALWTLYQKTGTRQEREISRTAVTLALGWLVSYTLLSTGAQASESLTLPLLITSSLVTSGYFVTNLWLMVRLLQRKPVQLPGRGRHRDR